MNAALLPIWIFQAAGWLAGGGSLSALPPGTRGWETIPGVIRNDGAETFTLEIHTTGPVARVTMASVAGHLVPPCPPPLELRDDGVPPDREAGDGVFTVGPFACRADAPMPAWYMNDPAGPAGLDVVQVGDILIEESPEYAATFLVSPSVGILRRDLPATPVTQRGPDLAASPHLANLRTDGWDVQNWLRDGDAAPRAAARRLYSALPDAYDFLVFLSTNRIEHSRAGEYRNFVAGEEAAVRIDYDGTGRKRRNAAATWNSPGRLLGVIALDAYDRGLYSANLAHEILHQWSGWLDPSFGLTDAEGHYNPRSSVGSLLGGQKWLPTSGSAAFRLDCTEGRNGAYQASPLDRYLMGLVGPSAVGALHVYSQASPPPLLRCGAAIGDVERSVAIGSIISRHGFRLPGSDAAQRRFNLGFVAPSRDRLLTPTEMTFYETLAAHCTRALADSEPNPYVGFNWAPITRFFGRDTVWTSTLLAGDLNLDARVDEGDLELFARCATGPGVPYASFFPGGCPLTPDNLGRLPADLDGDGDVDGTDFAALQRMLNLGAGAS